MFKNVKRILLMPGRTERNEPKGVHKVTMAALQFVIACREVCIMGAIYGMPSFNINAVGKSEL